MNSILSRPAAKPKRLIKSAANRSPRQRALQTGIHILPPPPVLSAILVLYSSCHTCIVSSIIVCQQQVEILSQRLLMLSSPELS